MTETERGTGVAAVCVALVLLLTGCDVGGDDEVGTDLRIESVTMPDGRIVECVVYQDINEGGIDCDWANATAATTEPR